MKSALRFLGFLGMFLLASVIFAAEERVVAVSPGSDVGVAMVGQVCPTFSWTAVNGAVGYRVEVFEAVGESRPTYVQAAMGAPPVLVWEIQGAATSWTPSVDEGLSNGTRYLWYVRAFDGFGEGEWSDGKLFAVDAAPGFAAFKELLSDSLEDHGIAESIISDVMIDMDAAARRRGSRDDSVAEDSQDDERMAVTGHESDQNTWYGLNAGQDMTSGIANSLFGHATGADITSGSQNTMLGYAAGRFQTTLDFSTFVGCYAGYNNSTGPENTFMGSASGFSNTVGGHNTFLGYNAGYENTTAYYNTFIGHNAGTANTTAHYNTFVGNGAGLNNTTGASNTFIGNRAGNSATTGSLNTFVGQHAGYSISTGTENICLGNKAGYNETGSYKLYIDSSDTSDPLIYGEFDNDILAFMGTVGVGTKTPAFPMEMKKTGTNASIVVDRTDGATNYINATATFGNFGTVNNYPLRLVANAIWRMRINTDNSLVMKNGATCTAAGVWTNASSRDLKENIEDLTAEEAEAALEALEPVKYNYKTDDEDRYVGFIAEDVPDLVASKDRKGMSAMDVVAVLTKVVQEQKDTIARLESRIDDLEEAAPAASQDPKDEELKAKYAKILGEYKMTMEDQSAILKIHVEKGELWATPEDNDAITLQHVEGTDFAFLGEDEFAGKIEVTFEKDDQGEYTICVVTVKDLDMEMRGTKIKQG